jgi:glycosyltransferase involved in cell wall biosynthesis
MLYNNGDRHMRVAFLSFDFEEYCIRLASAVAQEAEVLLLLTNQQIAPHLSKLDQAVNFQPFRKPRLRQPLQQLRMIYTILQQMRRFNPDVIHIQQGHLWFNCVLPLLRSYPLVLTIHDPRQHIGDRGAQNTPQIIMDFGYHRAAQVIVHSRQLKQVVIDQCRIPSEIIHVIPHIVLGDDTAQKHVREDDHLILFFGRIWKYKGLEYLIRAEPLITSQVPNARIVIAGEGEDFTRYRRMMVHPEHFIVYNEFVSDDKRAELFRRASIVVLPYIEASQSGVIPLAYTFAKPVVATTVGGLPDFVDHGQTGFLVPPRDEKALANAIVRLLQDKALRYQLGANGKQKIDTECSPDVLAKQTLTVYHYATNGVHMTSDERKSEKPWADTSMQQ